MTGTISIRLNGDARVVASVTTIAELLGTLDLDSSRVAVERNRELVPRARHAETALEDGDVVEVVTLVGGG